MDRVLVIGVDSVAGQAVADQLTSQSEVCGLWHKTAVLSADFKSTRLTNDSLVEQCEQADLIVFCGNASQSSWDDSFGDFEVEESWLTKTLKLSEQTTARFVFISSDVVFGGPWVFHDDDSGSYCDGRTAQKVRSFETAVERCKDSLIVRSNVLGIGPSSIGLTSRIVERLESGESERVDACVYGTPIESTEFAQTLTECLVAGVSGYVNIGGAERTTAFRYVTTLANTLGHNAEHLIPIHDHRRIQEKSLRCQRLRQELKIAGPLLKETVDHVTQQIVEQNAEAVAA